MKTVKVTQTARGKFAPDTAVITVALKSESKRYAEAARGLNAQAEQTVKNLAEIAGLEKGEIQKSGSEVMQVRHEGKTYFSARTEIKVTLAACDARIDGVVAACDASGAPWRSEYVLADKSYRDSLAAEAVRAARASAESIAAAAGIKLGGLANVEYAASYGGVRLMRAAAAETCAEPEDVEAEESVTCEWEIIAD